MKSNRRSCVIIGQALFGLPFVSFSSAASSFYYLFLTLILFPVVQRSILNIGCSLSGANDKLRRFQLARLEIQLAKFIFIKEFSINQ